MLKQIITTVGKHKIPRFLYHMTSKYNYEQMLSSGTIRMSEDLMCGKGIFTSELNNLFKRGSQPLGDTTLINRLIEQVNTCDDKIVLFRIPTAAIDKNKLFVRSHKIVTDLCFSREVSSAVKALNEECKQSYNWNNYMSKLKEIISNALDKLNSKDIVEHLQANTPAEMANLYKQRKHAIEYIYKDTIPISVVEKIGECDVKKAKEVSEYPIRNIFSLLLKDRAELKGTGLLIC